jgi:hypothetical protein
MARELLAPFVLDERVDERANVVAVDVDADQLPAHHAAGTGGECTEVVPDRGVFADPRISRVEQVHVAVGGEARVERHPQQAAIPEVVHVVADVEHLCRGAVERALVGEHPAVLLRDEDAAVSGEPHCRRRHKAAEERHVLQFRYHARRRCR